MNEHEQPYGNNARDFDKLTEQEKACLLLWIRLALQPAKTKGKRTSYGLKHAFEYMGGFYVTNGEFKGAMRAAGYEPVDPWELNWTYRVKPTRQHNGKYYGYGPTDQHYGGYGLDQLTPEQQAEFRRSRAAVREVKRIGDYEGSYKWLLGA